MPVAGQAVGRVGATASARPRGCLEGSGVGTMPGVDLLRALVSVRCQVWICCQEQCGSHVRHCSRLEGEDDDIMNSSSCSDVMVAREPLICCAARQWA